MRLGWEILKNVYVYIIWMPIYLQGGDDSDISKTLLLNEQK